MRPCSRTRSSTSWICGSQLGGEKKKAAGRLPAAFRERLLRRGDDRAFPKLAQQESGSGARFHEGRSSMRGEKSSDGVGSRQRDLVRECADEEISSR